MLKLYYAPGTCARASHIALAQSGASYETARLDFSRDEQKSPDYLRVNGKGRVPALATDRGVLTETPAILMFIAQSFPQAQLAPLDDPFALAQINSFNSYLCATVHVAHAHKQRGHRWADDPAAHEAMRKRVPKSMGECFELIETELFKGPWVMGERYSVSDAYLFTVAGWLKSDDVDIARFPKVADHRRRMGEISEVQQVIATESAPL